MPEQIASRRTVAIVCLIGAAILPIGTRIVTGPRGARVHVRWEASVDDSARRNLETKFRLADAERLEGQTWAYDLVDPSADIVRALVLNPAVADTHHIDRSRFVLDAAERTGRRGRIRYGDVLVAAGDGVATASALMAALLTVMALRHRLPIPRFSTALPAAVFQAADSIPPYVFLTTLGLAIYARALWLPPTNGDDLSYLSSVATIANPLYYFFQDHGHGNELYRPLTPLTLWVSYKVFGVWSLPNQLVNLALHLVNVFLLYRIAEREQRNRSIALLVAAVFMISQYTWLAATWTSDRPMLLTGLFLLLLVDHLSRQTDHAASVPGAALRISVVAGLSVLALMSKESGLVVPALALLFALVMGKRALIPRQRRSLAVTTASIMGLYVVFRILLFGADVASYSQDGYLFLGLVRYQRIEELPQLLQYVAYAENIIKNAIAPILPVFAEGGSLLTWQSVLVHVPVIASTALLFGLAARRDLSGLQWIALFIIVANALVHFALFRLRLHYLSHAAVCLFVAGSPGFKNLEVDGGRALAAKVLAVIVLVGAIVSTSYTLNAYLRVRYAALDALPTEGVDGYVRQQVLQTYK